MDNRPVGIFDSGLGGLTSFKRLQQLLPNERLIYFGDTKRVPYGVRPPSELYTYACQNIRFLLTFDVKHIIIACGSVSSTVLPQLVQTFCIPMTGVVLPAASAAISASRNGKIGIIATEAAIKSGAYQRALLSYSKQITAIPNACPLLVPFIESGRFYGGDAEVDCVLRGYLEPIQTFECDTMILGCTHYPLLSSLIKSMLPGVTLIDAGACAAIETANILAAQEALSAADAAPEFYVSGDPSRFAPMARMFLDYEINHMLSEIDIEQF